MVYVRRHGRSMRTGNPSNTRRTIRRARSALSSLRRRVRGARTNILSAVRAAVNYGKEIKYVAQQDDPTTLTLGIATSYASGNLHEMVPQVTQGVGEHQRIGDRITPVRAKVHFTFWMRNSLSHNVDVPCNVEIILMCLKVKGASNQTALTNFPAGTLLRTGNGNNNDPTGSATNILQVNNVQPVNPDNFTLLRKYRIRLIKNFGVQNWADTSPPVSEATEASPNISSSHSIVKRTFSWKPPTLKYDNGTSTLPTNHYPIWLAWATTSDGSALPADANGNLCQVGVRYEMYFRDA